MGLRREGDGDYAALRAPGPGPSEMLGTQGTANPFFLRRVGDDAVVFGLDKVRTKHGPLGITDTLEARGLMPWMNFSFVFLFRREVRR